MRTVLRVGLVVLVSTSLFGGMAFAENACDSVNSACCYNVVQRVKYCTNGLTCNQANSRCESSGAASCATAGATCCPPGGGNATPYCTGGLTCNATNLTCESSPAPTTGIVLDNPLGVGTFDEAILKVLDILKTVGAPIAIVMVIVGGFQMLFAAGDPEKFKSGQKTILYSAIGYAIIFLADGIATLIQNALS